MGSKLIKLMICALVILRAILNICKMTARVGTERSFHDMR